MESPARWAIAALLIAIASISCGAPSPTVPREPVPAPSPTPTPAPAPAPPPMPDGGPRITIDTGTRLQTITGWEATAQAGQEDSPAFLAYRNQLFDDAVQDLGITRLRVPVRSGIEHTRDNWAAFRNGQIDDAAWRALRYATVNDNQSPGVLNERGFWFSELDDIVEKVVVPIKERLEALGRRLYVNVNYVAFVQTLQPDAYAHQDPEEYAEFVAATYQHLRDRFGIVPDAWEVILEPDNSQRYWQATALRAAMIAAGNRLEAMGITPRFIAPSTTSMASAVTYADVMAQSGLPRFWSELSYHRYSGVSEAALLAMASRAQQWNINTAMLEHIGSGYQDLHADLKTGRNSAWQQFTLAFPAAQDQGGAYYLIDDRNPMTPRFTLASRTVFLRQYFKFIRSGAVRIGAASSDPNFDPLAFINPDGRMVVVVKAGNRGSFAIQGLAPGSYGVSYTTARDPGVSGGTVTITPGSALAATIPDAGVMTIFGQ
jgi:hypothetical protein